MCNDSACVYMFIQQHLKPLTPSSFWCWNWWVSLPLRAAISKVRWSVKVCRILTSHSCPRVCAVIPIYTIYIPLYDGRPFATGINTHTCSDNTLYKPGRLKHTETLKSVAPSQYYGSEWNLIFDAHTIENICPCYSGKSTDLSLNSFRWKDFHAKCASLSPRLSWRNEGTKQRKSSDQCSGRLPVTSHKSVEHIREIDLASCE